MARRNSSHVEPRSDTANKHIGGSAFPSNSADQLEAIARANTTVWARCAVVCSLTRSPSTKTTRRRELVGLLYAVEVAKRGVNVGYVDWELDAGQHRHRLERLTGPQMPAIQYIRCERPVVDEVDRLERIRHEKKFEFLVYDSISPACDGPPEAAEVAAAYHRARRQIGCGGIDIAHINKGPSDTSEQEPFGSAFFNRPAASGTSRPSRRRIPAPYLSRSITGRPNLGPLGSAVGFTLTFTDTGTHITRTNVGDVAELAVSLPLWQRIKSAGRAWPQTLAALAEDLDAKVDTVKKAVQRHPQILRASPVRMACIESRWWNGERHEAPDTFGRSVSAIELSIATGNRFQEASASAAR